MVTNSGPSDVTGGVVADNFPALSGGSARVGCCRARIFGTLPFSAVLIDANGKVMVAGGDDVVGTSAELYNPATGGWNLTGSLNTYRSSHTATLLSDGESVGRRRF